MCAFCFLNLGQDMLAIDLPPSVRLMVNPVDASRIEIKIANRSGEDVYFGDTIFNYGSFPKTPLGVTVYFRSESGEICGKDDNTNFYLGWNPVINPSRAYIPTDFLRILGTGDELKRVVNIEELIEGFKAARGVEDGSDSIDGVFLVVVRIALVRCDGEAWAESSVLMEVIESPGRFACKTPIYGTGNWRAEDGIKAQEPE
jgi:hypothetical protein